MSSKRQKTEEICGVCGGPNAVVHFGAITCRACGAFFRRTITMDLNFQCWDMEGHPKNRWENILNCKGCRQQKCLKIGMDSKLVKSVKLAQFRRERKIMVEKNDAKNWENSSANLNHSNIFCDELGEVKFVEKMIKICNFVCCICDNPTVIPDKYFERNKSLEAILMDRNNLLANSIELIHDLEESILEKKVLMKNIRENGLYRGLSRLTTKAYMVAISLAKTPPVFYKIELGDQIILVKNASTLFAFFIGYYYSSKLNSQVFLHMIEGTNLFEFYSTAAEQYSDQLIFNAARKIFIEPVERFSQIKLLQEEFVFLLAMVFTNSTSPGLSDHGRHLLKEEEEKYGRALLRLQQRRMGIEAGARRYTETLGLLWLSIGQVQKFQELIAYMDARYENGRYRLLVPNPLVPLLGL